MDLKTVQRLQTEMEELLERLGVDFVTPVVSVEENDAFTVDLETSDQENDQVGLIIGSHGSTLHALEYLVALMINKDREEWIRVNVDVDGYRQRREKDLQDLAYKMADKAKFLEQDVEMRPMSAQDRRIIHMALSSVEGVETESAGEGRGRHVVVKPL